MHATGHASQPLLSHQARTDPPAQQTSEPAGPLSAAGADVAARLQRIEALAAEIARAQVCAAIISKWMLLVVEAIRVEGLCSNPCKVY